MTKHALYEKTPVRCLGPNPKEHYFNSTDRIHHRICGKCAERMRKESARVGDAPVKMHDPSGRV